jgi:copper(I)-binding protein
MLNLSYKDLSRFVLFLSLTLCCIQSNAKEIIVPKDLVSITDAWVRPTNPGQDVGAAYMTFLSKQDMTLVNIESSATNSIEIHNMTMENGVMKMRLLENLHLKANEPYKLAPGGLHLMLFDLKKPLIAGEQVSFILHFKPIEKIKSHKNIDITNYKKTIQVLVKNSPDKATQ